MTEARKTLYVSDALAVCGTYAGLYYVKSGDEYGYVSPEDVFAYSPDDRAAMGLEITAPTKVIDYVGFDNTATSEHKISLEWQYQQVPAGAYLMVGLIPNEDGISESDSMTRISSEEGIFHMSYGLYETQAKEGWYNAVVEIYTADGKILAREETAIYLYASYAEYYAAISGFNDAFAHSATRYDEVLFMKSAEFAKYAYDNELCCSELRDLGFSRVKSYNYFSSGTHTVGYCIGEKDYTNAEGEEIKIYAVIVRGSQGINEWISNFDVGASGYHYGFDEAAKELTRNLALYIAENAPANMSECKIWITGHSRGAAVSNLVAAKYARNTLGLDGANIYAYTFACPCVAPSSQWERCDWIRNYDLGGDLVPKLPLKKWGFIKYGITETVSNSAYLSGSKILLPSQTQSVVDALSSVIDSRSAYVKVSDDILKKIRGITDSTVTAEDVFTAVSTVSLVTIGSHMTIHFALKNAFVFCDRVENGVEFAESAGATHNMNTYLKWASRR